MSTDLRAALGQRLAALQAEAAARRGLLADLQARQNEVVAELLRIDRAVRILQEELTGDGVPR